MIYFVRNKKGVCFILAIIVEFLGRNSKSVASITLKVYIFTFILYFQFKFCQRDEILDFQSLFQFPIKFKTYILFLFLTL